jgi:hypothetical protein
MKAYFDKQFFQECVRQSWNTMIQLGIYADKDGNEVVVTSFTKHGPDSKEVDVVKFIKNSIVEDLVDHPSVL